METGVFLPSTKFVKGCDLAFGTNGLFAGLLKRVDEGDHPSWFIPYLHLERKATRILDYSANLVPGILQTEDYARAMFRVYRSHQETDVVDGKAAARARRREVFDGDNPPLFWAILHEACLRTVTGDPGVMVRQLEQLMVQATSLYVTLQVLPFTAGAPATATTPFTVLRFSDSRAVLYTENRVGGRMHDSAKTVQAALDDYDLLRASALSPDQSLSLIQSLLKEYQA